MMVDEKTLETRMKNLIGNDEGPPAATAVLATSVSNAVACRFQQGVGPRVTKFASSAQTVVVVTICSSDRASVEESKIG